MDNACGVVARLILSSPQSIPLDQVLPVFLNALPLKKDMQENKSVYNSIFSLFRTQHPALSPHVPTVISIFARVLGNPQVEQELQIEMVNLIKSLISQHSGHIEGIIKALPSQEQQNLQKFLS